MFIIMSVFKIIMSAFDVFTKLFLMSDFKNLSLNRVCSFIDCFIGLSMLTLMPSFNFFGVIFYHG